MSAQITAMNPATVWQVPETFKSVYSHATLVKGGSKQLFISGQFGVRPDGTLPEDFSSQIEQALDNVEALLKAGDMELEDIAKLNFYLTRAEDAPALVKARANRWSDLAAPAVTVVTVTALAKPEYLVEVEATAIR